MKTYELTYIITSGITSDEVATATKNTEAFILKQEGVIVSSHTSGAQTLAYPIKKNSSGYFSTVIFQLMEDKVKKVKEMLDLEKEVLRSAILVKHPVKIMKERRTRKPVVATEVTPKTAEKAKKTEKLDEGDLDKKLDEILN